MTPADLWDQLAATLAAFGLPALTPSAAALALAALFVLLLGALRLLRRVRARARKWIILDGSNVMHWKDGTPQIETVQEVLRHLKALGFTPGVMFDANAGYLLSGRYRHDDHLSKQLKLPEKNVMVVPKGVPADPAILTAARDLGARIVTNDRYRDWYDSYPELRDPDLLIRGGYRSGKLWLDLAVPDD